VWRGIAAPCKSWSCQSTAIIAAGGRAIAVTTVESDETAVGASVAGTIEAFSGLHIAFVDAGINGMQTPIEEVTLEEWHATIDTNGPHLFSAPDAGGLLNLEGRAGHLRPDGGGGAGEVCSGKAFYGYCAAKRERFFGWRLHLVCTTGGVPIAFELLSGGLHDLTPIHELTYGPPAGASVYGDKGDNAADNAASIVAETDVRLVPIRRANRRPHVWADKLALRAWRKRIETLYSQLEAMGAQRLCAHQPRPGTQAPRRPARGDPHQCRLAITVKLNVIVPLAILASAAPYLSISMLLACCQPHCPDAPRGS